MEKQLKEIEIPFGAKDSELKGWEYTIPEGMEAEIKDGKIIVKEKESEGERIRKAIIKLVKKTGEGYENVIDGVSIENAIAWLEKQGENNMGISEATKKKLEDNLTQALGKETPESWNKFLDEQGEQNLANSCKTCENAWSEEDEKIINKLIAVVELYYGIGDDLDKQRCLSWLNSLKDRYTWKPTKEQLTELRCVISGCSYDIEPLVELEKELKAL